MDPIPFVKKRLFTPGPTPISTSASMAMLDSSLYHRSEDFYSLFLGCRRKLSTFFGTKELPLILTSSGSGAMEAAVTNLTAEGDKVLVVEAGKFGERWTDICTAYKCNVVKLKVSDGKAPSPSEIVAALKGNADIGAIFLQANETSTGVFLPLEKILPEVRKIFSGLIVVDGISALCAHPMHMDNWQVDCMVSGSQKGFGIPPGLAFIALAKSAQKRFTDRPRFYFDLRKEEKAQAEGQTAYTPAISIVQALSSALQQLENIGLEKVLAHHKQLATATRAAMTALNLELFAPENYSHALTSVKIPVGLDASAFMKTLKQRYQMVFAGGQGNLKGKIFRMAHLGFMDPFELISGIAALEFALRDNGYKFTLGSGVTACMEALHL